LPVRAFVCAASGASVLTTVALGYALVLGQGELPRRHPWPLLGLSLLGITLCSWAFRRKPLGSAIWLAAPVAMLAAALWFSSLLRVL